MTGFTLAFPQSTSLEAQLKQGHSSLVLHAFLWCSFFSSVFFPIVSWSRLRMLASAVPLGFAARVSRYACLAVVSRGRRGELWQCGHSGRTGVGVSRMMDARFEWQAWDWLHSGSSGRTGRWIRRGE